VTVPAACASGYHCFLLKQTVLISLAGIAALSVGYLSVSLLLIQREIGIFRRGFDELQWARITYENRVDGTRPLYALAIWKKRGQALPLTVVMHGFADSADEYFSEARYWAQEGRFCLLPDMRGRVSDLRYPLDWVGERDPLGWHIPGWYRMVQWLGRPLALDRFQSAGRPDANGAELLDIEAAIREVRRQFGGLIAPSTDIVGYSGGGSNALLAAARMPYLFDRAVAFFPIVDFARQYAYHAGRGKEPNESMRRWIGGDPEQLPHHYAMRSALTTLDNLRYTRAWVFADRSDRVCPVEFAEELARAAQHNANISVLISEPSDRHQWQHGTPNEYSPLHDAEFVLSPSGGGLRERTPPRVEVWIIAGYLVLPDIEIYFNDLQQGIVRCTFTRHDHAIELSVEPLSAPAELRARVRIRQDSAWVEHRDVPMNGRVALPLAPGTTSLGMRPPLL
jgi:dienelactone hydrolase